VIQLPDKEAIAVVVSDQAIGVPLSRRYASEYLPRGVDWESAVEEVGVAPAPEERGATEGNPKEEGVAAGVREPQVVVPQLLGEVVQQPQWVVEQPQEVVQLQPREEVELRPPAPGVPLAGTEGDVLPRRGQVRSPAR
jgi:hypothetical protein